MRPELTELTLCRAWREGWHARELRTTAGQRLHVVYPGVWTNSDGPDFRDAFLEIDGRLVRGAVEVHLRSSTWHAHGHQHDPAYAAVVLHVVLEDDLTPGLRTPDGEPLPTLELGGFLAGTLDELLGRAMVGPMAQLGVTTCLPTLAGGRPDEVRAALRRKGWERLAARELRFRQAFEHVPPAQALYAGMLDALGFSRNRGGMAQVAERLPLHLLERMTGSHGWSGAAAALLGVGGLLPLSEAEYQFCGISPAVAANLLAMYEPLGAQYALEPLDASDWTLNRTRPANHPARRLASMAGMLTRALPEGLLARVLACDIARPDAFDGWLAGVEPKLGTDRRAALVTNVFAPFLAAYAGVTGDDTLAERAGQLWERLPGRVSDSVARAALRQIAGDQRLPIRFALEEQGLHQIGRLGCAQLRCFECPIAELAARYEDWR